VTTNDGTPILATIVPCPLPRAAAIAIAIGIASRPEIGATKPKG